MDDDARPATAEAFADWIGRRRVATDTVDQRLVERFRATLSPHLAERPVPAGIFWCLGPDVFPPPDLGRDGHPRTGLVLPPVPFARRMWAGGELRLDGDFSPGETVEKESVVEDIAFKTGGTGRLCFVAVRHRYRAGGRLVVDERQDIVYRAGEAAGRPKPAEAPAPADARWTVAADPVLLFRYSALTFNGHRIHYDQPYATGVEGYAGLVVHGPLQATLMLNLAADRLGRLPARFAYRGAAPLVAGPAFSVEAVEAGEGAVSLRVVAADGTATMTAVAEA